MKKVKALKVYRVKETGAIAHPGHILDYPEERAQQLADGGWVEIIGDSDQVDTAPAALTGVPDEDAPPVDGEEGAGPDDEELKEEPSGEPVHEKAEIVADLVEKVDEVAAKSKRGRKPKSEE